jgi:hypothetical protein
MSEKDHNAKYPCDRVIVRNKFRTGRKLDKAVWRHET